MKTIISLLIINLFFFSSSFAQWTNNGNGNNHTNGKVGIGTTNNTGKKLFVVQNSSDHSAVFQSNSGNGVIINSLVDPLRVGSSNNHLGNLFIIDETGTVGINTSFNFNTNYKLHVNGSIFSSGGVAANFMSAFQYFTSSDRNLKTDIKEDFSSFNKLYDIKTYNYKLKSEDDGKRHFGVMAQEIAKVYPDLVIDDKERGLAVNYIEFIPQLIRAVQEQKQMITALEAEISNLKSELKETATLSNLDEISVIYPNPTSASVTVQLKSLDDFNSASVEIFDLNGKVLVTKEFDNNSSLSIDTSKLNKGVYFVRLLDGQQILKTKRLVVE